MNANNKTKVHPNLDSFEDDNEELEIDSHIFTSKPDIIMTWPPVTTQPTMSSLSSNNPWTYTPAGVPPLSRQSFHGSLTNIYAEIKAWPAPGTRETVATFATPSGSRDWSSDLFDTLKDVQHAKHRCKTIQTICCECVRVPCTMCSIARSLGDKWYLPFIPGTGAAIRFKVRILGGIQGSIDEDCVVMACCCPCATCQMHREIEDIGLGPTS